MSLYGNSENEQKQNLRERAETGSAIVEFDKLRTRTRTYNILQKVMYVAAVIIGIVVFIAAGWIALAIYAVVAIAIIIVTAIKISAVNKEYTASFKENIVKAELESVLQNVDYKPAERFNDYTIKTSGLFPGYDSSSGNDYFSADYNGRRYTMSDVHLEDKEEYTTTDSDGDSHTETRYTTLFRGRMIMFDCDAVSDSPVYIYDRKMRNVRSEIRTESDAFNEQFVIRADDGAAALRILTPQMIEKIMYAAGKINSTISISFLQDKVFVAVTGANAFEAKIIGDTTLNTQRERIRGEVMALVNTLEALGAVL